MLFFSTFLFTESISHNADESHSIMNAISRSLSWTTALCINCRSIWKQVMEIYHQSQNRLYWRDAHENRIRLIAQPYFWVFIIFIFTTLILIYIQITVFLFKDTLQNVLFETFPLQISHCQQFINARYSYEKWRVMNSVFTLILWLVNVGINKPCKMTYCLISKYRTLWRYC